MSDSVGTPRGTRVTPEETSSERYHAHPSHREMMQQELMDLGVWLNEHPEALKKNLKSVRDRVVLEPGVYYNQGTGMIDRVYSSQHIALGGKIFRVSRDPAAPIEEIRRRVLEGK